MTACACGKLPCYEHERETVPAPPAVSADEAFEKWHARCCVNCYQRCDHTAYERAAYIAGDNKGYERGYNAGVEAGKARKSEQMAKDCVQHSAALRAERERLRRGPMCSCCKWPDK